MKLEILKGQYKGYQIEIRKSLGAGWDVIVDKEIIYEYILNIDSAIEVAKFHIDEYFSF